MSDLIEKIRAEGNSGYIPLCVDLDDTLVRTDLLWEGIVQLWRHPAVLCSAFLALLSKGKAAFKAVIAQKIPIDPTTLPWREEVVDYLRVQKSAGRELDLAT